MRGVLTTLVLFVVAHASGAKGPPEIFPTPLTPRIANYRIQVRLDAEKHTLRGRERVTWRNLTADTVSEAWFHLYLNAFANNRTVFMRESSGQHRQFASGEGSWGYCKILSITLAAPVAPGGPLPLKPTYPGEDRTVMRVELPHPVPPGGEASFEVEFEAQLPTAIARSGFVGDFHMAGQWFPKLGVYEEDRGWNCHPYHAHSEFFADFGAYDVAITVPTGFVVGATGVEWDRAQKGRETTFHYRAEDVHDFAWAACPRFVEVRDRWERGGRTVAIRYLMLPGNLGHTARYAKALKAAMDWTADHMEPFPYPAFTLVDPGLTGAAGMEYPTLVTGGTHPAIPSGLHIPEMVVVHEFAHNYFQGICASNEFEEAWLDEGFTTYCEARILEAMYGKRRSMLDGVAGWSLSSEAQERMGYLGDPSSDPVVLPSWKYRGWGSYSAMSYAKPALMLRTLENMLGRDLFDHCLRTYYEGARFRHPTTEDFERLFTGASGRDLGPLLHALLRTTATVDFQAMAVKTTPCGTDRGWFEKGGTWTVRGGGGRKGQKGTAPEGAGTLSVVTVRRNGELVFPVEIRVTFEGGAARTELWDGRGCWTRFSYRGPAVVKVEVDPGGKIPLDLKRLNNGWQRDGDPQRTRGLCARARTLFQGMAMALLTLL